MWKERDKHCINFELVTRFGRPVSEKDSHSFSQSDTPRGRQISLYASHRHAKSAYQTNPIITAGTDTLQA
jgi:hypothetical protein